jgi:hypothetical protein
VMSSWVSGSNRIPKPFFLASVSSLATRFFWACYMEYKLIHWWVPFEYQIPLSHKWYEKYSIPHSDSKELQQSNWDG